MAHTVNQKMTKLRSLSAVFAVLLSAFASASLFAQETAGTLPTDSAAAISRQGMIVGTVTDINDSPVPRASVALQGIDPGDVRSVATNESGFFEIRDVEPGRSYQVSIRAAGFAEWKSPVVTLEPGQSKILDVSKLQIEEVQTAVIVTPESTEQMAIEQVKTEEKQRGFGILPNFYAVYTPTPAPLNTKLRFRLALRLSSDPFTLGGVAVLAGIGQATNYPQYVQGAKGYAERMARTMPIASRL